MSPRSDGVFGGMEFITQEFGRSAIVTLQSFAPPSIHTELKAQLPRLVKIHDSGKMPYLGITGQYRWLLAVWSRPSPLVVCLLVWPVDHRTHLHRRSAPARTRSDGESVPERATGRHHSTLQHTPQRTRGACAGQPQEWSPLVAWHDLTKRRPVPSPGRGRLLILMALTYSSSFLRRRKNAGVSSAPSS